MIALLLSFATPMALGLLLVRRTTTIGPPVLQAVLGLPVGLGLTSVWFFMQGLCIEPSRWSVVAGELALLFVVSRFRRVATTDSGCTAAAGVRVPRWLPLAFAAALLASVLVFVLETVQQPNGGGDAIGIWNLRARFLLSAWGNWPLVLFELRDPVAGPVAGFAHVDYPLLLPLLVTRAWIYSGATTALAPVAVAAAFTFGGVALLVAAVARLRGRAAAWLGGLALLATPFYLEQGISQSADIPLAVFALAAVVVAVLDRARPKSLWLAGAAAGCAAWTKNEGLLFALVIVVAVALSRRERRASVALVVGALPAVAALCVFKMWLAPSNDLLAAQDATGLADRLTDGARYLQVGAAFARQMVFFDAENRRLGMGFAALLVYALVMGRDRATSMQWWLLAVVVTMALAYAAIFVAVSPYDLDWHLRTAAGRLLLQLWPAALLWAFSVLRTPAWGTA